LLKQSLQFLLWIVSVDYFRAAEPS